MLADYVDDPRRLYEKFLELEHSYTSRNDVLEELDLFFNGIHWEDEDPDDEEELVRVTLNYSQLAALRQAAYMTSSPVRADVYQSPGDYAATRRESFLRSLLTYKLLWGTWVSDVEFDTNVSSYSVVQVMWAPPKGSVKRKSSPDAAGTSRTHYTKPPFKFRTVPPTEFYPVYRSYDEPDDFLFVFRRQEARLVEDLELLYDVELQATDKKDGTAGTCEVIEFWTDEDYVLLAITQKKNQPYRERTPVILRQEKHKYPRIPFFVVQNMRVPHKNPVLDGSLSDVQLLQPLNKHLNLVWTMTATEILTRMRPPVLYKSDMPTRAVSDIRMGAGEVIPLTAEEEVEPLNWQGIPATVAKHGDDVMKAIADLGGLPRTDLGSTGQGSSGVGMRLAYANLELVLALKIPLRVAALERILSFCLEVLEGRLGSSGIVNYSFTDRKPTPGSGSAATQTAPTTHDVQLIAADIEGHYDCTVQYPNLIPRDKLAYEQHVAYLVNAGLLSRRTGLEMLSDIPDPDVEIERLKGELEDPVLNPEAVAATAQAKQAGKPAPGQGPGQSQMPTPGPFAANEQPTVPLSPASPVQSNIGAGLMGRQPAQASGMGTPPSALLPRTRPGINQGPPMTEAI